MRICPEVAVSIQEPAGHAIVTTRVFISKKPESAVSSPTTPSLLSELVRICNSCPNFKEKGGDCSGWSIDSNNTPSPPFTDFNLLYFSPFLTSPDISVEVRSRGFRAMAINVLGGLFNRWDRK